MDVQVDFFYMCECTVGVDVRNGATTSLCSIPLSVVMRCIVLGRQMNVDFSISGCTNTTLFVGMDIRFCTMKIHDSMSNCTQTSSIVVHRRIIQSYFCIGIITFNPKTTILHKITPCCCNSCTATHTQPTMRTLFETTLHYINIEPRLLSWKFHNITTHPLKCAGGAPGGVIHPRRRRQKGSGGAAEAKGATVFFYWRVANTG